MPHAREILGLDHRLHAFDLREIRGQGLGDLGAIGLIQNVNHRSAALREAIGLLLNDARAGRFQQPLLLEQDVGFDLVGVGDEAVIGGDHKGRVLVDPRGLGRLDEFPHAVVRIVAGPIGFRRVAAGPMLKRIDTDEMDGEEVRLVRGENVLSHAGVHPVALRLAGVARLAPLHLLLIGNALRLELAQQARRAGAFEDLLVEDIRELPVERGGVP